jgi:hypothetical protein
MTMAVLAAAGVLYGTVTIGPLTPVCRVGAPCDGPAKRATLTFARPGQTVTVRTDGSGRYRVGLRAGTWSVRASVGMRLSPTSVTVRPGAQRDDFSVDTGIR